MHNCRPINDMGLRPGPAGGQRARGCAQADMPAAWSAERGSVTLFCASASSVF